MKEREQPSKQSSSTDPGRQTTSKSAVKSRNTARCRVIMLDGSEYELFINKSSKGNDLVDRVCEYANIAEKDYFSCSYRDTHDIKFWLNHERKIIKQLPKERWIFFFEVKFYPPAPSSLQEDITRYYLCLQVRTDILSGKLPCSFVTHSLLGSYVVQAEFGDWSNADNKVDITYIKDMLFTANQTDELLYSISELHRKHRGQTPAEAENNYLDNAKKLAMYGVHLHPAKDSEGVDIVIGVNAAGILVYRDRLRINRYAWAKILKISYRRNNFYVKTRPGEFETYHNTIGYKLENYKMAKRLWKLAVEHHAFFRLREAEPTKRGTLPLFGSKFRYSGRTQYQTRQASLDRPAPDFDRTGSKHLPGSRSLDTAMLHNNTERVEKFYPDESQTASLAFKERKKASAPHAELEDDQNLIPVESQPQQSHNAYGPHGGGDQHTTGDPVQFRYLPPQQYATDQRMSPDSSRPDSSLIKHDRPDIITTKNVYITGTLDPNKTKQSDVPAPVMYHDSDPHGFEPDTSTKVSSRTYTAPDGTVITEHRTERDGIIETKIEKRLVINSDDEIDHDEALAKAIKAVTDMNPDLSVEKIEIETKNAIDN